MTADRPTDASASIDRRSSELSSLVQQGDGPAVATYLEVDETGSTLIAVSRLDRETRAKLLSMVETERAARLLEHLPDPIVVEAVQDMDPAPAARVIEHMPSNEQADLLGSLRDEAAEAILAHLDPFDAAGVQRLATYSGDVAGGLMITEYLAYQASETVADIIDDLTEHAERYADYDIQYAYVADAVGVLVGVLRLRDLLLSPRSRPVRDLMIPDPLAVRDEAPLDELVRFFEEHRFFGAPVVDAGGRLCGVVQRSAVEAAVAEDSERMYREAQGIIGGEELRSMPLLLRARRRLSWLSVNIVLNIIAASVIALHQDTLEAVIALAVFLPIISDMSGCSGNQAVGVSMRELTLGLVRPTELWRTLMKEVSVGLINGFVLGVLIGGVALVWQGNIYLGLVVGSALMLNTIVAVAIGGSVPLVLKRFKTDPAIASGPILTTITDMCGFFIVLNFASLMLSRLT